ncbi:MAG: MBOAT family protein [Propionibacteriaceae bacterium]|jgi:alginate O-acetyltransferase complex protein AlgI|nr:MBOAT family protein [Propionibacteriaceae bacterium]
MLFSSVTFLYYFLPVTLAVYFLTPMPGGKTRWRNLVLLLASLVFYAWGEPVYCLLMMAEVLVAWVLSLLMDRYRERIAWRRVFLIASLVVGLGVLAYFKYADFFISSFDAAFGVHVPLLRIALPIGISFYTFQMLSYAIDLYRGKIEVQRNPLDFACYVIMFPQLVAGPIVRYAEVAAALVTRRHTLVGFAEGGRRFVVGLAKKVLVANVMAELVEVIRASGDTSFLAAWLYVVAFALQIYFDFSGYSDMAIGLGTVLGFRFPENFNYPYVAASITAFWRRWHMSLSSWFRDYVYIPLGGNRVSVPRHLLNIAIVWGLTGFWHGAGWQFIAWGLWFAVVLAVEKYAFGGVLQRLPRGMGNVYTLVIVAISWVLFDSGGFADAGTTLAAMAGFGASSVVGPESVYYLRSYAVPLLVGIIGATPLPKKVMGWVAKKKVYTVVEPVLVALGLLVVTACLVDGSFNPFIYFRF